MNVCMDALICPFMVYNVIYRSIPRIYICIPFIHRAIHYKLFQSSSLHVEQRFAAMMMVIFQTVWAIYFMPVLCFSNVEAHLL